MNLMSTEYFRYCQHQKSILLVCQQTNCEFQDWLHLHLKTAFLTFAPNISTFTLFHFFKRFLNGISCLFGWFGMCYDISEENSHTAIIYEWFILSISDEDSSTTVGKIFRRYFQYH